MDYDVALQPVRVRRRGSSNPAIRRKPAAELDPLLRAALDCARHGLIILDCDKNIRLVTRSAAEMLGIAQPPGAHPVPLMRALARSPWLDEGALRTVAAALNSPDTGEPREILLSLPRPGGTRVLALDLRRAGNLGLVGSLDDVTQTRETQDWLLEHASSDPVTGLPNRQHFMLMLRDQLDSPERDGTAVLMLDLKRFKPINETLGTAAGDALLRLVGGRVSAYLRETDIMARITSNEFAIMAIGLPGREAVEGLCSRLIDLLSRPVLIEGELISVGAFIGAAIAPQDGDQPEELVANAGLALAASRAEARGQLRFFEPKLSEEVRRRRAFEADLRRAVSSREFELYYQPQVSIRTGMLTGFEALLRWRSAERGMISPAVFVPMIEELGLIEDLGSWIVLEACREAVTWPGAITVAVNASPLQVEAGNFEDIVARALEETGLDGRRLEIEITENLLLRDNGTVNRTLAALRDLGVKLVLDDFGTGYASLSQLTRFHFDKLKIDRSFISTPGEMGEHTAIVRSIAALGISLGVPTTAEGVETELQLQCVRENGCTSVQGYYYSKPVPASEVPGVIDRLYRAPLTPEMA